MKVGSVDTGHYVGIDRRGHSERTLGELSLSSPSEFVFRPRDLLIVTVPLDDVVSNVRVASLDIKVNHLVVVVTGALPAQLALLPVRSELHSELKVCGVHLQSRPG